MMLMFDERYCERATRQIVIPRQPTEEAAHEAWIALDKQLARIRTEFGDQSAMHYDWTNQHRSIALACLAV